MRAPISTAIDLQLYKECKARGLKWNQLIRAGYQHMTAPTASVETVKMHTEEIEALKKALAHYKTRYIELFKQVEGLKDGNAME